MGSVTTCDINGGTIDGTTIGAVAKANGTFEDIDVDDFTVTETFIRPASNQNVVNGTVDGSFSYQLLNTQGSVSLDTVVSIGSGTSGRSVIFSTQNDARDILFQDGIGNLNMGSDFLLDNTNDVIEFIYNGASWNEISRTNYEGLTKVESASTTVGSMTNADFTTVIFEIEYTDNLGEYDHTTGIFTATHAGTYAVSWRQDGVSAAWAIDELWYAGLSRNDSEVEGHLFVGNIWQAQAGVTQSPRSGGSAIVTLAATNTLRIKVYHNQGANVNTSGDETSSFFHIARIL